MIEYLFDLGSPAGAALVVFVLLSRKIDNLKSCILRLNKENSNEIKYIKGRVGL